MNDNEILSMKPGRELNKRVAVEVMGNVVVEDKIFGDTERFLAADGETVWGPLRPYSEDISAAELVVDRMIELGYDDAIYWADFGDGIYTEAEAISKAALLAVAEEDHVAKTSSEIIERSFGPDHP